MIDLNKMSLTELIMFLRRESEDKILEVVNNKEYIMSLDVNKLNTIFLNLSDELKKVLLDDEEIFNFIMSIPLARSKKTIIDLVSDDVREYIYNSPYLSNSINGSKLLELHLKNLSNEEITKLLNNPNLSKVYKVDIIDYIESNFKIDEYLKGLIINDINNDKFNSLSLYKIKNEVELLIYAKFDILVTVNINENQIFIKDVPIDYSFLRNVNRKHIVSLIDLIKSKEEIKNDDMLFISVIKLYMIFGLDNSKKIINNFFTLATPLSLKRVSYELFKENRREFRLKNQNKFYYHDMEEDFYHALAVKDMDFFKSFCLDDSEEYINNLIITTKFELAYLSRLDKLQKIKEIIDREINKREEYYKKLDTNKFYKYYKSTARKSKISYLDIYDIFAHVNVDYKMSRDGKIIIDDELNKFLLGNFKKDNDCLLRLVLNKHAFGLNRELHNIINHFEDIKEIISKNSELSINSISDVIDISKVFLYNLKPNELDITLETLSKILNSRKYCTEDPSVILKRVMDLHNRRKSRIAAAIEAVKGEYKEVKYKMVNFDSEDLLVSGIDTGSCLKVGGKGEEFFEFCLTDPRGVIFYIEYKNIRYVLPSTVNGNMLNINSIDPIIEDMSIFKKVIGTIKHFAKEIIDSTDNQIEMVTVTDIHLNKFFADSKYECVYFDEYLPLNTDVYCDYNKKEVTNYIILKKDKKVKPKYFDNKDLFYEKRSIPYVFSPSHENDRERMSIKINSISYSSIDYLDMSSFEKEREKYYYINKDINDYIYIVGNKDWYIGIKKDRTIDKCILPYDERAAEEYNKYLFLLENSLFDNNTLKR